MFKKLINHFYMNQKTASDTAQKIGAANYLCSRIQTDYYTNTQDGKYKHISRKGFLEKDIYIGKQKYSIITSNHDNESFDLTVKNKHDQEIFFSKILYGQSANIPSQHIIYIYDFIRLTPNSIGIGKEVAKYIRELAENTGFNAI